MKNEKGQLMAGLMALVAIMMIFSTLAFQAWQDVLHRDNEAEMMFRAQEIARAIQAYRIDHGGQGPMKLEDLMEPAPNRGNYYLRRIYKDPLVRDGKWGLLYMGPQGSIIDPEGQPLPGLQPPGQQPGDPRRQPPPFPGQQRPGGAQPPQQSLGERQPLGGIANRGDQAQTGLPIAGVRSRCEKQPFRIYRGLEEYERWLFTYLDVEQQLAGNRGGVSGQSRPGNVRP